MKKHLLLISLLAVMCVFVSAQDVKSMSAGLSGYKPIYFLTGLGDDQVKIQFSVKYDIFYSFFSNVGFYIAYSQLMFWDLYKLSAPFKNMNFNPEVFWRFESKKNLFDNMDITGLDYIQLGFAEHISNGMDVAASRGFSRSYVQFQVSTPFNINFGLNLKVFYIWDKTDNPDIENYIGNYEANVFLKILDENNMDLEEVYVRFASGGGFFGFDFSKGYQEIGIKSRPIIARFRPYLQFYHGYAESISEYNQFVTNSFYKQDFSVRFGVIID